MGSQTVIVFLMSLVMSSAFAESPSHASSEDIDQLASSFEWLHLGRWKRSLMSGGRWRSDIITDTFFLAENGRSDPYAELKATISALNEPLGGDVTDHAVCLFPGRAVYLRRQGMSIPDPVETCPDLNAFLDNGSTDSISVLFISGYLSNPGSAFGHLLLRLHSDGQDEPVEDVLDRAINYGAASSEDDPIIPYIVKGLFGGYQSTFTSLQFFHQAERYREAELRTIWQYKLDLDASDTLFLAAHVYELLRSENRYYFARQNCAWRIAEVLELVIDRDLIPKTKPWVTPIDIFHQLTGDALDGGDAVREVKRLASREVLFLEGYGRLPRVQQDVVDAVIASPERTATGIVGEAQIDDPRALYDVLIDYYAFTDDEASELARGREVTVARFAYPPSEAPVAKRLIPPHTGQRPSLVSISALYNDELGEGIELRLRPAYFDLLSSTVGTVPFSEVVMADMRFLIRDGSFDLRSLEAVRVTNLSPYMQGAPASGGYAWRVRVGAEDEDLSCDDCLLGYAEYGFGKSYSFARGAAIYGLVGGRLEAGRQVDSIAHVRPSLGLVINRRYTALSVEGGLLQGLDDSTESRLFGRAELRLGSGQRWDVRLQAAYDRALESGLAFEFYW